MSSIVCLERALDILTIMYENGGKMGVTDLSKIMDLHKSTVYRTLNTLYLKDFLYKDPQTSLYSLGPRVLTMGLVAATNVPLAKIAKPHLSYLSAKYEVNATISIVEGESIDKKCMFCLSQYLDTTSTILLSTPAQCEANDAYRPAIGLCLAAHNINDPLSEDNERIKSSWSKLIQKRRKKNYPIQTYIKDILEVRKLGYAYEDEDFLSGQIAVACPIINNDGEAFSVLSICGDKKRVTSEYDIFQVIEEVKEHAAYITENWKRTS